MKNELCLRGVKAPKCPRLRYFLSRAEVETERGDEFRRGTIAQALAYAEGASVAGMSVRVRDRWTGWRYFYQGGAWVTAVAA